tara:strand:- start:1756 stop:3114 length:1359 start_codon:yes stop_codon:yes gene_type:complete
MILRESIEKVPNNSILVISKNKKVSKEEILNSYDKAKINNLEGSKILICISDIKIALPIIVALDGLAESFALISSTTSAELILSYKKNWNFDAIICDNKTLFEKLKKKITIFCDFNSLIKSIKPNKLNHGTRWLIATSGTTGSPKLVSHTFSSLTLTTKFNIEQGKNIIWGMLYDFSRFAGLQVLLQSLVSGSKLIAPNHEDSLINKINSFIQNKCTHLSATPTLWRKILMTPKSKEINLVHATLGGEIADDRILSSINLQYPKARVVHIFASTEAGVAFSVSDKKSGFPKSYLNEPPQGIGIKIEKNKLFIRNEHVHKKYLGNDKVFGSKDGWIDTGDMVHITNDRILFRGREDGIINVGGDKVYPEEIENVLLNHPLVASVKVYAKSNPITGSLVAADVILVDNKTNSNEACKILREYSSKILERHKSLAMIKIVSSFDLNSSGKIARDL